MEHGQLDQLNALYRQYRPLLFSLAYRMLGTVVDAEDAVHDVFVKVKEVDWPAVRSPKAYLCRITTNRCLDEIKSGRHRREVYVGPWLPEPMLESAPTLAESTDPEQAYVRGETVSFAILTLLDRVNPIERAVFLLREAFLFDYGEIASILGKTEANCRKIHSRVRAKLHPEDAPAVHEPGDTERVVRAFLKASGEGDVQGLVSLLAEDAVMYSDGGGLARAALRPIYTRDRIVQFWAGIQRKASERGSSIRMESVPMNGETGIVVTWEGEPYSVMAFQISDGLIRSVYIVRNPEKLRHAFAHAGLAFPG